MPGSPPVKPPAYRIEQPESFATFDPGVRATREVRKTPSLEPTQPALEHLLEKTPEVSEAEKWDTDNDKIAPELIRRAEAKGENFDAVPAVGAAPEKRAIWVVHGMGQQIPFETLDGLAQGLMMVADLASPTPRMRTVKLGDQTVQRVEIDVRGKATNKIYELHLYESYWAPKTEGVAKLKDVVTFLKDGGFRGILNSGRSFYRALFGTMQPFSIPVRTPVMIIVALTTLLALAVVNGIILLSAASVAGTAIPKTLGAIWPQVTSLTSWMTAVALLFGSTLTIASMLRSNWFRSQRKAARVLPTVMVWSALALTLITVWLTGAGLGIYWVPWVFQYVMRVPSHPLQLAANLSILVGLIVLGAAILIRNKYRARAERFHDSSGIFLFLILSWMVYLFAVASLPLLAWHAIGIPSSFLPTILGSSFWIWPSLIFLGAQVRQILVQYVGDVAIYVTPNQLDRFDQVRTAIKDSCRQVASAIYLAVGSRNQFLYEEIALVGHSLGSVVAYDTINRLMLDDWLSAGRLRIAHRTNSLMTFGSPVEKTAFLFSIQGKDSLHVREHLVATVQPLIQSYPMFRKFPWINVYSRNDIISGKLLFYDLPNVTPPRAVENVVDEDARIPLIAHIQYWNNPKVWNALLEQIAP